MSKRQERRAAKAAAAAGIMSPLSFTGARAPGGVAAWSPIAQAARAREAAAVAAPPPAVVASPSNGHANGHANGQVNGHVAQNENPFAGEAYNTYQASLRAKQEAERRAVASRQMPQGETLLVHEWARVVREKKFPPEGATIWLQSIDQPPYEMWIAGIAVVATPDGGHPDRALYDYAMRNRQRPGQGERFAGRIEAPTPDGGLVIIGGGYLNLPPAPIQALPANQWGAPAGYQGGYGGGAYAPPYGGGGAPPWGGAPSPWGYPPMGPWGGMMGGGMMPGMMPYILPPPQPPPPNVQKDPAALELWMEMQKQASNTQMQLFQMILAERKANTPPAAGPTMDPWALVEKTFTFAEKINGLKTTEPVASRGVTIHNVDGTKVVENKDGDIDTGATIAFAINDGLKSAGTVLKSRMQARGGANGGIGLSGARAPGQGK